MNFHAIPAQLQAIPQWVCWRYRYDPESDKQRKPPYIPGENTYAEVDQPDTWRTFEQARDAYLTGDYNGVGFVLTPTDGIVGIDIDNCVDEDGTLIAPAPDIVQRINSYTEYSPSGRGIRIFAKAQKGNFKVKRRPGIEIFNYNCFLTVTGHIGPSPMLTLQEATRQISLVEQTYLQPAAPSVMTLQWNQDWSAKQSDERVLKRMFQGKMGHLYQRIYNGDVSGIYGRGTPDQSRADTLLFNALAFYTYRNAEQMRHILLNSPRAQQRQEKWHKPISNGQIYLDYQIADSIDYSWSRPH